MLAPPVQQGAAGWQAGDGLQGALRGGEDAVGELGARLLRNIRRVLHRYIALDQALDVRVREQARQEILRRQATCMRLPGCHIDGFSIYIVWQAAGTWGPGEAGGRCRARAQAMGDELLSSWLC